MSQLIQLKQRIKAVTTIKKITNAMRLISRALHVRLDKQKKYLFKYHTTVSDYLTELNKLNANWHPSFLPSIKNTQNQTLIIIIGSQKGLCGNFNGPLLYWIDEHLPLLTSPETTIIALGKKINDHLKKQSAPLVTSLKELKSSQVEAYTEDLLKLIFPVHTQYNTISMVYLHSKTFFNRSLKKIDLIPFATSKTPSNAHSFDQDEQEQNPQEILDSLGQHYIRSCVRIALFESLHAEQSARFISMDNATRNANSFLSTMKSHYNKIRQAKITKELAELADMFDA